MNTVLVSFRLTLQFFTNIASIYSNNKLLIWQRRNYLKISNDVIGWIVLTFYLLFTTLVLHVLVEYFIVKFCVFKLNLIVVNYLRSLLIVYFLFTLWEISHINKKQLFWRLNFSFECVLKVLIVFIKNTLVVILFSSRI